MPNQSNTTPTDQRLREIKEWAAEDAGPRRDWAFENSPRGRFISQAIEDIPFLLAELKHASVALEMVRNERDDVKRMWAEDVCKLKDELGRVTAELDDTNESIRINQCFLDCPLCTRATATESPYKIQAAWDKIADDKLDQTRAAIGRLREALGQAVLALDVEDGNSDNGPWQTSERESLVANLRAALAAIDKHRAESTPARAATRAAAIESWETEAPKTSAAAVSADEASTTDGENPSAGVDTTPPEQTKLRCFRCGFLIGEPGPCEEHSPFLAPSSPAAGAVMSEKDAREIWGLYPVQSIGRLVASHEALRADNERLRWCLERLKRIDGTSSNYALGLINEALLATGGGR